MPASSDCIQLRPVTHDDLPAIYQWQLDPASNRMAMVNPRSPESFNTLWDDAIHGRDIIARIILLDAEPVGFINCFKADGLDTVGYWIDRAHWGRGIATRALALMLDVFEPRPLHAQVAEGNAGSLKILKRAGFEITETKWSPASERYPACRVVSLVLQ